MAQRTSHTIMTNVVCDDDGESATNIIINNNGVITKYSSSSDKPQRKGKKGNQSKVSCGSSVISTTSKK
jgi:hypothetical protein